MDNLSAHKVAGVRHAIESVGASVQHADEKALYKARNVIERFFSKFKQFRRVATRYDKLLVNFMGFVKIAAIAIMIR